ncbi:MAG: TPM domain-containing protein, partial [Lautropia sp.]|nr:TPM domain-containing protein [Lautropia sp.]
MHASATISPVVAQPRVAPCGPRWLARLCAGLMGLWLLMGLVLPAVAQQLQPVPPLAGSPVVDRVGMLSPAERQALADKLRALDRTKGSQLAVLIVSTTQPESIEQYSLRVVEAWKLGRGKARSPTGQAVDDGVLLLVARDDRRARIEVGYGLEGAIPDAIAARIIDQQLLPRFRQQDWAGGINGAADAIIARINGEDLPTPVAGGQGAPRSSFDTFTEDVLPLMFFMGIGGVIASGIIGRLLASLGAGGVMGFSALGLLGSPLLAVLCGLAVLGFVGLVSAGAAAGSGMRQMGRHTYRGGRGGGFGGGFGGGG